MTVRQVQWLLLFLGYSLEADGIRGPVTEAAEEDFRQEFPCQEVSQGLRQAVAQQWQRPQKDFWGDIRYFSRNEPYIGCSCGKCGGFPAEPEEGLMVLADRVREHFGAPMTPTSTVRCKAHNRAVGGVANSRHLLGKAMDFKIRGHKSAEILEYVKKQPGVRYAYAVNANVVHMDI